MARLLVALLLVATAYATDYVLSGASGGLQTLTRDGTTEWSGVRTPNVQANRYTAGTGDVYIWFREPVPTPLATLQPATLRYLGGIDLALNSTDNVTGSGVVQWGPSMYRVLPRGFIPYGLYVSEDVADTSLNFYCNQTLPASRERFRCINAAETIVADYSFGPTGLRMVLTPNSVPAAQVNRFVALMFTRLMVLDEMNAMTSALETSGKDRLSNSRVTVAVMWTFINLTIFFICGLLASWCAWFFPLFNGCTRKFAVPIYWLIWAVITAVISWAGGLGGYILIVVLMVFFIIVSHIIYCCVRQKRNSGPVSAEAGGDAFAVETDARPPDDSLPKGFTRCRDALGRRQMIMMGVFAICMLISLVIMGIIFYAWTVPEYMLWDRLKNTEIGEFIPQNIQKGLATVYVFEGLATNLKMDNIFFEVTTSFCDTHYTQPLAPGDRQKAIYQDFIQKYNIDMTEYIIEDYNVFPTVNDWFIRQIKPSKRPIASADDDSVIVSPADARITVFPTFPSSEIWLKTDKFDVHTLVGASNGAQYEGGSMTIVRLAPQDYHRFHMPAAGVMAADYIIEGSFHSVGVDGMRSDNFAIYNQRRVMIFTADDARIGTFAYVAVGATCVGSIAVNGTTTAGNAINRHYEKGQELGYFQFGGSTVVLVFKAGVLDWSDDLLTHSEVAVEALVQMGNAIATVRK